MSINKVLFVTSEVHPLVKTGGLADVSGSLPTAIKALRRDVRIIMPAYRSVLAGLDTPEKVAALPLAGQIEPAQLLKVRLPGSSVPVYLVDSPAHFDRDGGPYTTADGDDWPDNAERFTAFARAVEAVATDTAQLGWRPDIVHCNDWQSGLVPALLARAPDRPATLFTIHNLAYQGLFPRETFQRLGLPHDLWSMHAMEYFGRFSFIKGGIVFADMINTVSPQYAREICTPAFGCGLETLLQHRARRLVGILNGADYRHWNPARDRYIVQRYNAYALDKKLANKIALQKRFNLPVDEKIPLVGLVGRLAEQKGFDLLLSALPRLMQQPLQFTVLGSGDKVLENSLRAATETYPDQVAAYTGYNEELAHQIEAGADMFLMPSRYEPCGLNQIYSLRYGTIPIVRRTGGLADTVIDATHEAVKNGTATGFVFDDPTPESLLTALNRALVRYQQPRIWRRLAYMGMQQDFSWRQSARRYLAVYQQAADLAAGRAGA